MINAIRLTVHNSLEAGRAEVVKCKDAVGEWTSVCTWRMRRYRKPWRANASESARSIRSDYECLDAAEPGGCTRIATGRPARGGTAGRNPRRRSIAHRAEDPAGSAQACYYREQASLGKFSTSGEHLPGSSEKTVRESEYNSRRFRGGSAILEPHIIPRDR